MKMQLSTFVLLILHMQNDFALCTERITTTHAMITTRLDASSKNSSLYTAIFDLKVPSDGSRAIAHLPISLYYRLLSV